MSDIAAWLENLGLDKYRTVFAENDVDIEVLPHLSDQDLKDLGVSLGHRRKLLAAVVQSNIEASAGLIAHSDTRDTTSVAPQAERRQLTVMFVDLVGSTALSGQLDPEDLSVLIRHYQNTVSGEINRLEGFVAKFMGDGVLAYFGWPMAHEDEAERAVRAALAIVDEVGKLTTPDNQSLAARIGIATGQVVVGDIIGEGSAQEETVVGETPNIAARLEALSEPGIVLISGSTRKLCGEVFEFEQLGAQSLKGVTESVDVYRVGRERTLESRFQARHMDTMWPLIGRERELAQLMERWRQAKDGEGQMILLTGEAGIGKSRLILAVEEALAADAHYRINNQCSSYHSDTALYPAIQQITKAAGIVAEDSNDIQLDKLESLLKTAHAEWREQVPLLAVLLNLDIDVRYGPLDLTPQQQRSQTLQALLAYVGGLAQQQPVLFIIEDAHWIDPTTLELLELALDVVSQSRILLLITARPTFEHALGGHPIATRVMLNALGREASQGIIQCLSGGKTLPQEFIDDILHKTDGVPLFVEELTKTVLESGLLRETKDIFVMDEPLAPLAIPASLHDSLLARLDRLSPNKEIAQTAACIGREFSYELLAAVVPVSEEQLQSGLNALVEAELVYRRGQSLQAQYLFKHALVRDAAYQSLLRSKRQLLHRRIAELLQDQFPKRAETEPELLAHHYTQAELTVSAVEYWQRAGQLNYQKSMLAESLHNVETGLNLTEKISDQSVRYQYELELQVALGKTMVAVKGYAAPETGEAFSKAKGLSNRIGDRKFKQQILYGLCLFHLDRNQIEQAQADALELLSDAEPSGEIISKMVAHRLVGTCSMFRGQFERAREHLEKSIALYNPEMHRELVYQFATDPRITALSWISPTYALLGDLRKAELAMTECIALAEEFGHPFTHAYAMGTLAVTIICLRDAATALQWSENMNRLCKLRGYKYHIGVSQILHGWALSESGQLNKGIGILQDGLTQVRATGAEYDIPRILTILAELQSRDHQDDLTLTEDALAQAHQTGERWYEAETLRVHGKALLNAQAPDLVAAERCFLDSLAVARQQGSKLLELRAATSLAWLWQEQNRGQEAHDLLAPVYDWFNKGFDTPDLKDARALLGELA